MSQETHVLQRPLRWHLSLDGAAFSRPCDHRLSDDHYNSAKLTIPTPFRRSTELCFERINSRNFFLFTCTNFISLPTSLYVLLQLAT